MLAITIDTSILSLYVIYDRNPDNIKKNVTGIPALKLLYPQCHIKIISIEITLNPCNDLIILFPLYSLKATFPLTFIIILFPILYKYLNSSVL